MNGLPAIVDGRLKDQRLLDARAARARARRARRRRRRDAPRRRRGARPRARPAARAISILRRPRLPRSSMKRARAAGFSVAPTGLKHGTVTLIVDGLPIETTTLREDIETDGRHAKVRFGRDFAAGRAAARLHHQRALARAATAPSTITPAASPISPRAACASSATRAAASARTFCAACASFAFRPAMAKGRSTPTAFAPPFRSATAWRSCRASACAPN